MFARHNPTVCAKTSRSQHLLLLCKRVRMKEKEGERRRERERFGLAFKSVCILNEIVVKSYGIMVHLKSDRACVVCFCRVWPRIAIIPSIDIFFDFTSIFFVKQCRDTSIKYIETFMYVWVKYEFSLSKRVKCLQLKVQPKIIKSCLSLT